MKKVIVVLSIALVIFLIIKFPHETINPGELLEAHKKIKNECLSCHKPFGGVANEKCIACHNPKSIGTNKEGNQNKPLFHQQLSDQECSSCHTEHQGAIPEHSLGNFKHTLLSKIILNNCNSCHVKPTNALHTQVSLNCNSCHQTQSWKNLIAFNHEILLNKNNCTPCHQKPVDNFHASTNENCDKCHSTNKWKPSTFNHSAYFLLDQNHNTTCKTCHSNNNFSTYTCYGCHEHSESNIIAEHNEEGIYNIGNCVSCHKSGNEQDMENTNKKLNEHEQNKIREFIKAIH